MKHDSFSDDDVPEEVRRAFERDMESFDRTEPTAPFETLASSGIELPDPATLDDAETSKALWQVINGLAFLGVYLHHTDHLDDRELYSHLWHQALRQEVVMMPGNPNFGYHLDLIDSSSDEDEELFLRYYADEDTRQSWAEQFPSYELPPRGKAPNDRDKRLPDQAHQAISTQAS